MNKIRCTTTVKIYSLVRAYPEVCGSLNKQLVTESKA